MSLSKHIPYIVAGGCAALLILACIIWYCCRRSRSLRYKEFSEAFAARDQTLQYDEILSQRNSEVTNPMRGQVAINVKGSSFLSPLQNSSVISKLKLKKDQSSDRYAYHEFNPFESPNYEDHKWKGAEWSKDYEPVRSKLDTEFSSPPLPSGRSYLPHLDVIGENAPQAHILNKTTSRPNPNMPPLLSTSPSKNLSKTTSSGPDGAEQISPNRKYSHVSEPEMSSQHTVVSHTSSSSTVRLGKHQLEYMNKQLEAKSLHGSSSRKTSKHGSQSRLSTSNKQNNSQLAQIVPSRGLLREDGSYVSAVAENKATVVKSLLLKKAQAKNQS